MVHDLAFIIVLIIAISVTGLFVVFLLFVKSMMPSPLLYKVLKTFHAAIFGYENALVELLGSRGYKTHVFPKIVETIKTLKGEDEKILDIFEAKTPKEAMEKMIEVFVEANILKGPKLIDEGDDNYTILLPNCSLCDPIHGIMGQAKGICPDALVIAAASTIVNPDKVPTIEYSEFTPTGTKTKLKLVDLKE